MFYSLETPVTPRAVRSRPQFEKEMLEALLQYGVWAKLLKKLSAPAVIFTWVADGHVHLQVYRLKVPFVLVERGAATPFPTPDIQRSRALARFEQYPTEEMPVARATIVVHREEPTAVLRSPRKQTYHIASFFRTEYRLEDRDLLINAVVPLDGDHFPLIQHWHLN